MAEDSIRFEVEEGIATITLNRPRQYNAFNRAMARELRAAWERVKGDPAIRCVVLTGAGDKALCTGMDVADVASGDHVDEDESRLEGSPFNYLTAIQNQCWKPVVTAVNGMVVGGGLHFIADSDLVVCAEHATFLDTHVKVGLVAGLEPVGLARRLPLEAVLRMALLGGSERLGAREALALGLVGDVVPGEAVLPRARELALKIAQHSPAALARTKRAIWESLDGGLHEGLENAWEIIRGHSGHPDIAEGATAFVEKRAPRWAPPTE